MTTDDIQRFEHLKTILRGYGKLAIAFSGGVDSAFLLYVASTTLGVENVLAVTATAENFPAWEADEAEEFATTVGARRVLLPFDPLSVPEFAANLPERCYHCKKAIFTTVIDTAKEEGFPFVADGTNADDPGDYRPGLRAVHELGVVSPLLEAGLSKPAIRRIAQSLNLAFWDKPSFACLASRFPTGEQIDRAKLRRVEQAETYLLGKGFRNIRVRSHGDMARVEVDREERQRFYQDSVLDEIDAALKRFGYKHVALDMAGYRTGSMNTPAT